VVVQNLLFQGLVGLTGAMYLWLIAAGLTLIFGVLRVLNFAHGSLYMLGAYFALSASLWMHQGFWPALAVAAVGVGVLGVLLEVVFVRPIYRLAIAYQLLLTFAFVLIFNDAVKMVWGPLYQAPPMPAGLGGSVVVLGRPYPVYNLFILLAGVVVAAALWLVFDLTPWGRAVRAAASDREMAAALGVNVPRLFSQVFGVGAGLAGLGGALTVPMQTVSPGMGENVVVDAFVVVVIGGLGNLWGAFVGALLVGLLQAYGTLFVPVFDLALAFIVMAAVLIWRPAGLFGRSG
jgi:branched-subunit amino acid ABC-type transport system permease component